MIVASLFAAAVFFQPPAHATEANFARASAEEAAVARLPVSATKVTELEKGFWVCDYLGTTRGIEGPHAVTCGANFEELKQTKFGGDFEMLVTWWRLNKVAQHKALKSAVSAQF
jgi:hypothetical protein